MADRRPRSGGNGLLKQILVKALLEDGNISANNISNIEDSPDAAYLNETNGESLPTTKLDIKAPYKANNFFSRPTANRLNANAAYNQALGDQEYQRRLSFLNDAMPAQLKLAEGQAGIQTRQAVDQQTQLSPLKLKEAQALAELQTQQAVNQFKALDPIKQASLLKELQAKNTSELDLKRNSIPLDAERAYQLQAATNGFDPKAIEAYRSGTSAPRVLAASLEARAGVPKAQLDLSKSSNDLDQFDINKATLNNTQNIRTKMAEAEAMNDQGLQPKMFENKKYDANAYAMDRETSRLKNSLMTGTPGSNVINIKDRSTAFQFPLGAKDQMVADVMAKARGGESAPTVFKQAPPEVQQAPVQVEQQAAPAQSPLNTVDDFEGFITKLPDDKKGQASNEFFYQLGTKYGFPKQTYGSSSVPLSPEAQGAAFRDYIIEHPDIAAQLEAHPEIKDIYNSVYNKFK